MIEGAAARERELAREGEGRESIFRVAFFFSSPFPFSQPLLLPFFPSFFAQVQARCSAPVPLVAGLRSGMRVHGLCRRLFAVPFVVLVDVVGVVVGGSGGGDGGEGGQQGALQARGRALRRRGRARRRLQRVCFRRRPRNAADGAAGPCAGAGLELEASAPDGDDGSGGDARPFFSSPSVAFLLFFFLLSASARQEETARIEQQQQQLQRLFLGLRQRGERLRGRQLGERRRRRRDGGRGPRLLCPGEGPRRGAPLPLRARQGRRACRGPSLAGPAPCLGAPGRLEAAAAAAEKRRGGAAAAIVVAVVAGRRRREDALRLGPPRPQPQGQGRGVRRRRGAV